MRGPNKSLNHKKDCNLLDCVKKDPSLTDGMISPNHGDLQSVNQIIRRSFSEDKSRLHAIVLEHV